MKGKLYTSYFAKLNKGIGIKISIARFNPKWLKPTDLDYWYKTLAPKIQLLNDYKYKGISWDEYTQRYMNYLAFDEESKAELNKLKQLLNSGQDVTVYCYEKPSDNCHRHLVGSIFRDLGYEVEEIK